MCVCVRFFRAFCRFIAQSRPRVRVGRVADVKGRCSCCSSRSRSTHVTRVEDSRNVARDWQKSDAPAQLRADGSNDASMEAVPERDATPDPPCTFTKIRSVHRCLRDRDGIVVMVPTSAETPAPGAIYVGSHQLFTDTGIKLHKGERVDGERDGSCSIRRRQDLARESVGCCVEHDVHVDRPRPRSVQALAGSRRSVLVDDRKDRIGSRVPASDASARSSPAAPASSSSATTTTSRATTGVGGRPRSPFPPRARSPSRVLR